MKKLRHRDTRPPVSRKRKKRDSLRNHPVTRRQISCSPEGEAEANTDVRVLLETQTVSSRSHVWIPPGRLDLFQTLETSRNSGRHKPLHNGLCLGLLSLQKVKPEKLLFTRHPAFDVDTKGTRTSQQWHHPVRGGRPGQGSQSYRTHIDLSFIVIIIIIIVIIVIIIIVVIIIIIIIIIILCVKSELFTNLSPRLEDKSWMLAYDGDGCLRKGSARNSSPSSEDNRGVLQTLEAWRTEKPKQPPNRGLSTTH
ncbi:hypothetical protein STEG23_034144 [Scotinomys teguina]